MNNHQQQESIDHQERFKKLEDFLRKTGFTGHVPFTLSYRSLSSDEKTKFINEAKAVLAHVVSIASDGMIELHQLLNMDMDTSDDDDD